MAKQFKKKNITKSSDIKPTDLIIHQINQVNVDRTAKDVQYWRNAHRSAESIHYPNRSRLLDLYADIDLDGHLTGVWGKRRAASTKRKLVFVDATDKEVDAMESLIKSKKFRDLKKHIVDEKTWGLSGAQFIPGMQFDWEQIPRKHILIEKCLIKTNQTDQEGRAYQDDPFIMVYGDKHNLGLLLKVSFYALIKKGNFSDWAQYSEIFGQPIRVVKYDAYDDKTRIQLKQVLDDSGSSLALMIPKQAEFDIMDGKTSNGNGELQEKLKAACNNEISLIILGNTETSTNENGGSNAKAVIQDEGEDDIKDDDFEDMLSYLNDPKFLNILAAYGYPTAGGRFKEKAQANPAKIKEAAEAIKAVQDTGAPVDHDTVYELTGLSKPQNYKELIAQKEAEKQLFHNHLNQDKIPFKTKEKTPEPEDLTDSLFDRIRIRLANFFDPAP
jgi:hypothetical protein